MAILPGLLRAASGARQSLDNRAVRAALLSSAASVVVRAVVGQYDFLR